MSFTARLECNGWIVHSAGKGFVSTGPHTCIVISRPGYVVASVHPRRDDDPEVKFCGMRPFQENRDEFWEMAEVACELARLMMRGDPVDPI